MIDPNKDEHIILYCTESIASNAVIKSLTNELGKYIANSNSISTDDPMINYYFHAIQEVKKGIIKSFGLNVETFYQDEKDRVKKREE